jgi:hypothetical protein
MASSRNRQMINVLHNEIQEKKRKEKLHINIDKKRPFYSDI